MARKKQEEKKPPRKPERWLDAGIVEVYQHTYEGIDNATHEMKGEPRKLMHSLMSECGVTELEAINILNDHHVDEYINKYVRLKREYDNYYKEREAQDE